MLMVIFGAGASYDSSRDFPLPEPPVVNQTVSAANQNFGTPPPPPQPPPPDPGIPWRPPLTSNLFLDTNAQFGSIVQKYPKLHGILDFLRRPQSGSVEQQLELYLDQASADQERTRQLLSVRYYLHDLFRMVSDEWLKRTNGVTNYATLIDQIRTRNTSGEPVCLVSFNYDVLLDNAISALGASAQPLERLFDAHPVFKLFKPHGSITWARLVDRPAPTRDPRILTPASFRDRERPRRSPQQLIEQAPQLDLSKQYVIANATEPTQMFNFDWSIIPAIAIPVQTKTNDTFEWPDTHRAQFESLLPRVRKILIIGWRAKEEHFLNLLRENLPKGGLTQITHLQVVGRDTREATNISEQFIADIRRDVKKLPTAAPAQGFSQFVRQELVNFLFTE